MMTWPKDCLVIPMIPGAMPWENPEDLISYQTQRVFNKVVGIGLLTFLFIVGCPANIVNMIVFFKQGLSPTSRLLFLLVCVLSLIHI